jgi:zinc and cadmium transporter
MAEMNTFLLMILVILAGSALSLISGSLIFLTKKRRDNAILFALPFGAGALLAAAFLDLLPESFELAEPSELLLWTLGGFVAFFLLERLASWFHHHHEHGIHEHRQGTQNTMLMIGDLLHNAIDGIAIASAFLANPATGVVTTLAVSAHEIPKELGTFGMLISRGWRDKRVLLANALTAIGTLLAASLTYWLGSALHLPVAQLLAVTAGFFVYVAASDIIPDIHEQPRKIGTLQALVLLGGLVFVGTIVQLLGV